MATSKNIRGFVCPEDWWQAAQAAADAAGISRSEWLRQAIFAAFDAKTRKRLTAVTQGRPKKD